MHPWGWVRSTRAEADAARRVRYAQTRRNRIAGNGLLCALNRRCLSDWWLLSGRRTLWWARNLLLCHRRLLAWRREIAGGRSHGCIGRYGIRTRGPDLGQCRSSLRPRAGSNALQHLFHAITDEFEIPGAQSFLCHCSMCLIVLASVSLVCESRPWTFAKWQGGRVCPS